MTWPAQPVIYEVNTAVWLTELSRRNGGRMTLTEVGDEDWDAVTPHGVDAVWLMGVWERSPAGLAVARTNGELMSSFRDALPDVTDADIVGSPYCVRRYAVDARFGGPEALKAARAALAERGARLVLDYVPNHVAPDHPWVSEHPDLFVSGTAEDAASDPQAWMNVGSAVLAHGRDPYFAPWPDVVQLNAFAPTLRAATANTLADIADQCDGIRCDMAMLAINRVFAKTWGHLAGVEPAEEFWPTVIAALRARHPETVLLAEAYWDLEWELQHQGFDFCYDKRLYDRLLGGDVLGVHDHLRADLGYQSRLVRFLENHDEPRVASRLEREAERAAAVAIATLPGATLWHEGQFDGRRVRPPVFLARRPDESADPVLHHAYEQLLSAVADSGMRDGTWQLLEPSGWPDNQSANNLVAWCWYAETGKRHLVVINLSSAPAQGLVRVPWPDIAGVRWVLVDLLSGARFDRAGNDLVGDGIYVGLNAWGTHVLSIEPPT